MSGSFTDEQIRRYSRQIILPEVGGKGQKKLLASRVLVLGAGGLGSSAIAYMAVDGVGTLGIVDDDIVEMSNLQRQIIHEYDFVVDGSDNFPTHYLINDVCVLVKKPCSHGSILRYEGYTTTTIPQKGPCYRCIFKKTPPPGLIPSCQEAGVLGVLPGIIGTIQASEALKYILGIGELLAGRLLCFNALDMSFFEARADKRMDCAVCGEQPQITKIEQKNYLENRKEECGL